MSKDKEDKAIPFGEEPIVQCGKYYTELRFKPILFPMCYVIQYIPYRLRPCGLEILSANVPLDTEANDHW